MPIDDASWAPIIPELVVTDFDVSLPFWIDALGFEVMYRRTEPEFAMLRLGRAQVMLEVVNESSWLTGELIPPLGRGMNLEIEHSGPGANRRPTERAGNHPLARPEGESVSRRWRGDGPACCLGPRS